MRGIVTLRMMSFIASIMRSARSPMAGCAEFIGSYLTGRLLANGHEVADLKYRLRPPQATFPQECWI